MTVTFEWRKSQDLTHEKNRTTTVAFLFQDFRTRSLAKTGTCVVCLVELPGRQRACGKGLGGSTRFLK